MREKLRARAVHNRRSADKQNESGRINAKKKDILQNVVSTAGDSVTYALTLFEHYCQNNLNNGNFTGFLRLERYHDRFRLYIGGPLSLAVSDFKKYFGEISGLEDIPFTEDPAEILYYTIALTADALQWVSSVLMMYFWRQEVWYDITTSEQEKNEIENNVYQEACWLYYMLSDALYRIISNVDEWSRDRYFIKEHDGVIKLMYKGCRFFAQKSDLFADNDDLDEFLEYMLARSPQNR